MRLPNYKVAIVAYSEIGLKSRPVRAHLENLLIQHLRAALKRRGIATETITKEGGRIYIRGGESDTVARLASRIFGVEYSAPAFESSIDLDAIIDPALELANEIMVVGDSFAVDARRIGRHPYTSKDLEVKIGAEILGRLGQERGLRVNLKNPDKRIYIEAREKAAYIYSQVYGGVGGFPYGSQGRVVALLTCDLYSAVAAWLMMKRGTEVVPLYLDAPSILGSRCYEVTMSLVEALREYVPHGKLRLTLIPFEEVVKTIRSVVKDELRFRILYERAAYMLASELSKLIRGEGIVTGCCPHPTAGYPLELLLSLRESASVPIFCPIIGLGEVEVSKLIEAVRLPAVSCFGGWERRVISSVGVPKVTVEEIKFLESRCGVNGKISEALEDRRTIEVVEKVS